jgi:hypothetical protein
MTITKVATLYFGRWKGTIRRSRPKRRLTKVIYVLIVILADLLILQRVSTLVALVQHLTRSDGRQGKERRMIYNISAMVVYTDQIEADCEEEALDKFMDECPYDIDGDTIECECVGEE